MAIAVNSVGTSIIPDLESKLTANANINDVNDGNTTVSRDDASARQKTDQVSITPSAAKLQAVEKKLASLPVVDQARVDKLKSAVESGEYQIDTQRIAEKFLQFESELYK